MNFSWLIDFTDRMPSGEHCFAVYLLGQLLLCDGRVIVQLPDFDQCRIHVLYDLAEESDRYWIWYEANSMKFIITVLIGVQTRIMLQPCL